jgi:hypothetical protein
MAGCAVLASAQTKISGIGKCTSQPDVQQSADVGDRANHALSLVKQKCAWTTPIEMEGLKSTTYEVTVTSDSSGAKSQDRGYVIVVMDNGDKILVRFQGTGTTKDGKPDGGDGTWSYTGGTGKLKGITGKGTYKSATSGEAAEDHIEGEYTLPAPKSKK